MLVFNSDPHCIPSPVESVGFDVTAGFLSGAGVVRGHYRSGFTAIGPSDAAALAIGEAAARRNPGWSRVVSPEKSLMGRGQFFDIINDAS